VQVIFSDAWKGVLQLLSSISQHGSGSMPLKPSNV